MQPKIPKNLFVSEITAFEVVPGNSAYCDGNSCTRKSMCEQTVQRFQIGQRLTFSNYIFPIFKETFGNTGAAVT